MKLSIVVTTWNRSAKLLRNSVETLSRQTVPPLEIVIVDQNPEGDPHAKDNQALAEKYELARIVRLPRTEFTLSHCLNVGVQETDERAEYVMTTGMEMIFGPNVVEEVERRASPKGSVWSPCGFLPSDVDAFDLDHVVENWERFKEQVFPNPPRPRSTGTIICLPREFWFRARGYDETRPFNYADSDLHRRATMGGLTPKVLQWPECQILHPWHERPRYFWDLGGIWPLESEKDWVRNPGGWGRLP